MNLHQRISERVAVYQEMDQELVPQSVVENLNPALPLRPYQKDTLRHFVYYLDHYKQRIRPTQLLFHMATGSGKTLIMAAAMLYLYGQGYRNFIFFVNSTNIIEKTRQNFLTPHSAKYLFAPILKIGSQRVIVQAAESFQAVSPHAINILFSTIQGLHSVLNTPRENALTYEDFEGQPVVLISDEAHHINALTKTQKERSKSEIEHINTWEGTVDRIFQSHHENLLLEFTATVELSHLAVAGKYRDKILYEYSLKQFREDGYSKEVKTLQADLPRMTRALQAVVISQYRKKVAERHRIKLKPVVLMKANLVNPPTSPGPEKVVSSEFRGVFHEKINGLTPEDLEVIKGDAKNGIVQQAFAFFEANGITFENLIRELQDDFSEEKAISVDSLSDSKDKQLLVNSLENPGNEIRVVFAVEKLNEGWDVLNLFDIVRLYNIRDAREGRPGKTTIAEAQLIGRGARYYPFQLQPEDSRYQRKFDDDLDNELRVLEELYYHSAHNPRYIQELRTALVETGMIPERPVRQLRLNIKCDFKRSNFWERGVLFTNDRVRNDNADVFNLQDSFLPPRYSYRLRTGHAEAAAIFDQPELPQDVETLTKTLVLRDFNVHLLRAALAKLKFYQFDHLRNYFPHLDSITQFITSEDYLAQVEVDVTGAPVQLENLSSKTQLEILIDVLGHLADDIRRGTTTYIGTKEFKPSAIKHCVKDRTINREYDPVNDVGTGMRETTNLELHTDLRKEDWYVYDENYGTSEEKALVRFIQNLIPELRPKYEDIYLLRNEKLFQLYNFADGGPFEPDFVLFLTDKTNGDVLSYQLFIEPKGEHLIPHDQWKEDFLKQIEARHQVTVALPNRKFRLVGLPFFNAKVKKREFQEKFRQVLL